MKTKLTTSLLALLFVFSSNTYAAEYNGRNIDGIEFDCSAYSYDTGNWYYVTVEFSGDVATITFSHGGYITLTLDDFNVLQTDRDRNWHSVSMRVDAFNNGVAVLKKHPFVGVGIGDVDSAVQLSFIENNSTFFTSS